MTSRSLRLTSEDLENVPAHCSLWFESVPPDADGRKIPEYIEAFPLFDEFHVNLEWGWEPAAFKLLIAAENRLIRDAEHIRDEAVEQFKEARRYDNRSTPNLGIKVRIRADTFGPRIHWVRFTGKGATGTLGKTQHYTEPYRLSGRFRTSKKIFAKFPCEIRQALTELEDRAANIRYQVDKLSRFRKLLYEPQSLPS
jgi:hypothetical protein